MGKLGIKAVISEEKTDKINILSGKSFVFTGGLKDFSRDDVKRLVEELGGRATSIVSKDTDYVVVGKEPGSKYDKAKKLGLTIISEEDFKKLIGKK